jgi:ComEC/Rec2-related protein
MRALGFWLEDVVFAAATAFSAGTLAADLGISFTVVFWATAIAACGALIVFRHKGLWKLLALSAAFLALGIFYFHLRADIAAAQTHLVFNKKIAFSAIVTDEPKLSASGKYLVLQAEAEPPFAGQLTVLAAPGDTLRYGDEIKIQGKINSPSANGGQPLILPAIFQVTAHDKGSWWLSQIYNFRKMLVEGVAKWTSPEAAGYLSAVAFSAKEGLTPSVAADMAASGTGFLATLYGMKIALLAFFVRNSLLGFWDRRLVIGLTVFAALMFVLLVGAPVAALRAAIMALIALWAAESGGVLQKRNALACAAAGMALWEPTVVGDMGFLASFGSVLGVIYLAPALVSASRFKDKGFWNWKENVAMNLAAQLGILPIIASAEGGFPLISLLSGAALILFLPLTVVVGWVAGLLGNFVSPITFLFEQCAGALAAIELALIRFFAAFSLPVPIQWNLWTTAAYYGALIWFALRSCLRSGHVGIPGRFRAKIAKPDAGIPSGSFKEGLAICSRNRAEEPRDPLLKQLLRRFKHGQK